nr:MAG TPA: hypothetical protein [Caudoviricetes sp.]
MAKFIELENGRLFNAAHILELGAVAKINYESDMNLRVNITIRILGTDGNWRDLINKRTLMPFRHAELPEGFYDFIGSEIEKLEGFANSLLTHEVHKMCIEGMKVYHPGDGIRRELQQATKDSAERIEEATQKAEEEDE